MECNPSEMFDKLGVLRQDRVEICESMGSPFSGMSISFAGEGYQYTLGSL